MSTASVDLDMCSFKMRNVVYVYYHSSDTFIKGSENVLRVVLFNVICVTKSKHYGAVIHWFVQPTLHAPLETSIFVFLLAPLCSVDIFHYYFGIAPNDCLLNRIRSD